MGKWDGMVSDTAGHGHGNLLVLLVACRGLGACHLSVLMRLESLPSAGSLVVPELGSAVG